VSHLIAVSGKGGTGKTTIAALVIRELLARGDGPVLGIDADPNSSLADALGVSVRGTIGGLLKGFLLERDRLPPGMTKGAYLEMKLHEIIAEGGKFDLLAMGHGEGPGCYCAVNSQVRAFHEKLAPNYRYVVVDNQAGMEHFSRRVTPEIDTLFLIADHSRRGIRAARKIRDLAAEIGLSIRREGLIVNRVPGECDPSVMEDVQRAGLDLWGVIAEDPEVERADIEGTSLADLPSSNGSVAAIRDILGRRLNGASEGT